MEQHRSYDVVVVGARAAGAATAMLLARRGLRVLVTDREPAGRDTLSTHALMRTGVVHLERWGLLDDVVRAGTPAVRQSVFRYGAAEIPVAIKPAHGVDALYAPRRTVLDPLLVEAARDAGADVRHRARVTAVRRGDGGRVTGVTGVAEGRAFGVSAPVVVGADGVRSTIAHAVGAEVVRTGRHAGAYVYGYWPAWETDAYRWYFAPGASAGVIPTNGGLACVFGGTTAGRFAAEVRGDLPAGHRLLLGEAAPEVAGRLAGRPPVAPLRGHAGVVGFRRRSWGPGWVLVGDAGSYRDPVTAYGISAALRDAELVAPAVAAAVDAGGDDTPLAAYQQARDEFAGALLDATDRVAAHPADLDEVREAHLGANAAMRLELGRVVERAAVGAAVAVPA